MFRGAIILALGYVAGYSHAVSRHEEITKAINNVKQAWAEAETAKEPSEPDPGTTGETTTPEGETPA